MRYFNLLKATLLVLLLTNRNLFAQTPDGIDKCATMEYLAWLQSQDPTYATRMEQLEADIQEKVQSYAARTAFGVFRIPVVVHVLYNNSTQNLSDAQIQSQITILNQDFRRLSGTPGFGGGVDTQIEFYLATVNPNGNPTNGITRTATSVTAFFYPNSNMKYTSQGGKDAWNRDKYLNIWVCNLTNALGFAQFPNYPGTNGSYDASTDGVVCTYGAFGNIGTQTYPGQFDTGRTATHEVGHWFGLRHTWGDQNNCDGTDLVDDTPPCRDQYFSGASGVCDKPVQCNNQARQTENYMDYSYDRCMNLFTNGQSQRMRAVLETARPTIGRVTVTVTQQLSSGTTIGSVGRWNGTSFLSVGTLPKALNFLSGTTEILKGDQVVLSSQKYNVWKNGTTNVSDVVNHRSFLIGTDERTLTSQFAGVQSATINAELIGSGTVGATVEFKDPWLIDVTDQYGQRNQGIGAPFKPAAAPLNLTLNSAYKGVFLNQGGNPSAPTPPYYSVKAPEVQSLGGNAYLFDWTASGATVSNPNAVESPVIFQSPNSTVTARFKLKPLLSSTIPAATGVNSQRKLAYDASRNRYVLIYESDSRIWLTTSADGGTGWSPELLVGRGKNPSVDAKDGGVSVVFTEAVGSTSQIGYGFYDLTSTGTLTLRTYDVFSVLPQNALPDAHPVIRIVYGTASDLNVYIAYEGISGGQSGVYLVSGSAFQDRPGETSGGALSGAGQSSFYFAWGTPSVVSGSVVNGTVYQPPAIDIFGASGERLSLVYGGSSGSIQFVEYLNGSVAASGSLGSAILPPSIAASPSGTKYVAWTALNPYPVIAYKQIPSNNDLNYPTTLISSGTVTQTFSNPTIQYEPTSYGRTVLVYERATGQPATQFDIRRTAFEYGQQSSATALANAKYPNLPIQSASRFAFTQLTSPYALGTGDKNATSGGGAQPRSFITSTGASGDNGGSEKSGGASDTPAFDNLTATESAREQVQVRLSATPTGSPNATPTAYLDALLSDIRLRKVNTDTVRLNAKRVPDTLAVTATGALGLLHSQSFALADSVSLATVSVQLTTKNIAALRQGNRAKVWAELYSVATNRLPRRSASVLPRRTAYNSCN